MPSADSTKRRNNSVRFVADSRGSSAGSRGTSSESDHARARASGAGGTGGDVNDDDDDDDDDDGGGGGGGGGGKRATTPMVDDDDDEPRQRRKSMGHGLGRGKGRIGKAPRTKTTNLHRLNMAEKLLVLVEKHSKLHKLKLEQQAQILCMGKAESKALAHITARCGDISTLSNPFGSLIRSQSELLMVIIRLD